MASLEYQGKEGKMVGIMKGNTKILLFLET